MIKPTVIFIVLVLVLGSSISAKTVKNGQNLVDFSNGQALISKLNKHSENVYAQSLAYEEAFIEIYEFIYRALSNITIPKNQPKQNEDGITIDFDQLVAILSILGIDINDFFNLIENSGIDFQAIITQIMNSGIDLDAILSQILNLEISPDCVSGLTTFVSSLITLKPWTLGG